MKKILSILMAMAMLFAFAAIPAMAEEENVDFSQNNLVYQTTSITRVEGSSASKFTSNRPKMVDGDITTSYEWSGGPTATFKIDLGAEYTLTDFVLYEKSFNRGFTVSLSTDGTTVTNTKEVTSADFVQTTVNGTEVYKGALTYTTETARYITVSYPSKYSFIVAELLVKGTPVTDRTDTDKVAADKAALDLGDTTAVTANLTLPTAGTAYGSTITWATTDASVITADGKITRGGEDKTATLTATITSGDVADTKTFDVTVKAYEVYNLDLSAENNILLGKTVTPIVGHYYSSTTPSADKQFATDGDLTTSHNGYGKVSGQTVGVKFSADLEGNYLVDNVTVLLDAGQPDRAIKIYNGAAVDEANLLGTYECTAGEANYVVAGEQEKALSVYSCDLPEATVASHLTFAYESGYGFTYYEIAATGRAVQEGEIIRDFTSSDNLAYKKDNAFVIGHYYSGWTPATDDLATDGDIATTKRASGKFAGEGEGNYYGFAFSIDLGAYYNLSEITLYTPEIPGMSIAFHSEKNYTTTGAGKQDNKGGYILNSQGGILRNGLGKAENATAPVNVNGTQVYANTLSFADGSEPVRYLIVHVQGGTLTYNELYVAGTPFTGELSFAEADYNYVADEEAGTKTVTAKVALMNTTDAVTSGIIYYAAYNEDGALVGMTMAAITELAAGAAYETPVTFSVTDAVKNVKAFYWTDTTFVPIITDIDFT